MRRRQREWEKEEPVSAAAEILGDGGIKNDARFWSVFARLRSFW
jgi:hypothetical protein